MNKLSGSPMTRVVLALAALAAAWIGLSRVRDEVLADYGRDDSAAGPVAVVPVRHQHLGTVSVGGPAAAAATFPVHNAGGSRLIVNPPACCGEPPQPVIIAPGRSAELVVPLDLAGRRGAVHQRAQFATSDPNLPVLVLSATADVR
jgi:hypothetical protein